jgi:hypothetical protein
MYCASIAFEVQAPLICPPSLRSAVLVPVTRDRRRKRVQVFPDFGKLAIQIIFLVMQRISLHFFRRDGPMGLNFLGEIISQQPTFRLKIVLVA